MQFRNWNKTLLNTKAIISRNRDLHQTNNNRTRQQHSIELLAGYFFIPKLQYIPNIPN